MNKLIIFLFLIIYGCNTGNLTIIADLPKTLNEVSGTETTINTDLIWMLNDSGNKAKIYAVNKKGKIIEQQEPTKTQEHTKHPDHPENVINVSTQKNFTFFVFLAKKFLEEKFKYFKSSRKKMETYCKNRKN